MAILPPKKSGDHSYIRVGTLPHQRSRRWSHAISDRIFDDMEERESEAKERCGCLTKQSSHRLKFRSMRLHPTIVRVVIDMQLKIFF